MEISADQMSGASGRRVLIVEHDPDLAQLLQEVLRDEGYQAEWLIESPDTVGQIRTRQPDVLMVNLPPRQQAESYQLLDDLRADPVASRIPVLTMTTSGPVADGALASYNVRESMTKPLDLDDLLRKVGDTLGQPPMQAAVPAGDMPKGILAQAERIVAEHSREALFHWVRRLTWEPPWRARRDVSFANVLDGAPVLLEALNAALRDGNAADFFERHPEAVERAREHARTRRAQNMSLTALIREYTFMRDEIWALLARHLPKTLATADVLQIERAINGTLDRIVELTVPAYVGESPTGEAPEDAA